MPQVSDVHYLIPEETQIQPLFYLCDHYLHFMSLYPTLSWHQALQDLLLLLLPT